VSADRGFLRLVALVAIPLSLGACEWFSDFKQQPRIDPWEVASMDSTVPDSMRIPRASPLGSVPMRGAGVPSFVVSYAGLPGTIDSMSSLLNPTPASPASLTNGRKYYQINCATCHGDTGAGDGPMTKFSGAFRISLLSESALSRSDGYIYGMIRNGRGLMPTYNRVEHMDRWDVVNYVRGLQGKLGTRVETGPLGVPGQTGQTVPGFTETAPTRPAPFFRFVPGMRADSGRANTSTSPASATEGPGTTPPATTAPPTAPPPAPPPGGVR
jgi:mono/diheme cytochrome c family protein